MKFLFDFWKQSKFFLLWVVGGLAVLLASGPKQDPIPSASQNLLGSDPSLSILPEQSSVPEQSILPQQPMEQRSTEQPGYFTAQTPNSAGGLQVDCSSDPFAPGLHLRLGPDAGIQSLIPCNASGIVITGASVEANGTSWVPVQYGDRTGWVAEQYLR